MLILEEKAVDEQLLGLLGGFIKRKIGRLCGHTRSSRVTGMELTETDRILICLPL